MRWAKRRPGCWWRSPKRIRQSATTWCGWASKDQTAHGSGSCGWPRWPSVGCCASGWLARGPVVLTSATLTLGGTFDALARQWGLPPEQQPEQSDQQGERATPEPTDPVPEP